MSRHSFNSARSQLNHSAQAGSAPKAQARARATSARALATSARAPAPSARAPATSARTHLYHQHQQMTK